MLSCPSCESKHTVKNGRIHNGKQNYRCRDCGRQFVQDPQNKPIDQTTKDLRCLYVERELDYSSRNQVNLCAAETFTVWCED